MMISTLRGRFPAGALQVEIRQTGDDYDEHNPRHTRVNIATLACWHQHYGLGDEQIPKGRFEKMTDMVASFGRLIALQPIYCLEHGLIHLSSKPFNDPWDSGQIGWGFIRAADAEQHGINNARWPAERLNAQVRWEIDQYASYIDGDIYEYLIKSPDGEVVDGAGGYLDLDECRWAARDAAIELGAPDDITIEEPI